MTTVLVLSTQNYSRNKKKEKKKENLKHSSQEQFREALWRDGFTREIPICTRLTPVLSNGMHDTRAPYRLEQILVLGTRCPRERQSGIKSVWEPKTLLSSSLHRSVDTFSLSLGQNVIPLILWFWLLPKLSLFIWSLAHTFPWLPASCRLYEGTVCITLFG